MILIIAYGNTLREDDGAGPALGKIIKQELCARKADVELVITHQLMPELALEIARDEVNSVVFVDTRVASPDDADLAVQVYPIIVDTPSPSIGHHLNPAAVLVYARLLYGKQVHAWQVTVPGVNFEHGELFSTIAQNALLTATNQLDNWLTELTPITRLTHCPAIV